MNIGIKLERIKEENFIWIVYIFIVIAALYSNQLESDYYTKHNKSAFYKQKTINIIILIVAFFIYLYFVLIITEDLNNMEKNLNNKQYILQLIKLVGAILFLIGGVIQIITQIAEPEPDEIGFI